MRENPSPEGLCPPGVFVCDRLASFAVALGAQTPSGGCALEHAVELHRAGKLEEAMREYRSCLAIDPARVEVRSNLGAVLAKLGRYGKRLTSTATPCLKTAGPQVAPGLRYNLALAYYKSAEIPQAASELEVLRRGPAGRFEYRPAPGRLPLAAPAKITRRYRPAHSL